MYDDVYSNPEKHGLSLVGMVDEIDLSYEFDMFGVWKDENGHLYYASDSGCSCPSPFETYYSKDDLTKATPQECLSALDEWMVDWGKHKKRADGEGFLRTALMAL